MQCEGCKRCFHIGVGNFKFKESRSYRPLPCDHPLCVPKKCRAGLCLYEVTYVNSYTRGVVGTETFTFSSANKTSQSFSSLAFGCGYDNSISFDKNDGPNNVIAGVFGLGTGSRSFLKQLGQQTKGLFSYCLTSWSSTQGTSTFLHFGDDAQISRDEQREVQTTTLIRGVPRYHLRLSGISVQGTQLQINSALFMLRRDGSGGFVIDSGAGHTFLVPGAYKVLKQVMILYFQRYNLHPASGVHSSYDLCYNTPTRNVTSPSMTFHFEGGADLVIDNKAVFEHFANGFCMIVTPISERGPNILGAFQQANHRFLYDTVASKLSFVPEICHNN